MNYHIIGTAGHVDHGKTELIRALTGQYTDRLKEEKERGISIELGFASLTLPSGSQAGIVDVPGHEKFVRQMLAGIGGIDLVLLVIAADEGVMPQTKEHLEIIDLLQVRKGLIVLNKIDLVDDDWKELVKLEVQEAVSGSVLQDVPIIEVSAITGQGINNLITEIDRELINLPAREHHGPCRLPIDRTFSLAGFGTIVTGTMYQGSLRVGEVVKIEPGNLESRVRSLQVHGQLVNEAFAGQRVAVNLPNLSVENVARGTTLLSPGFLSPAQTLDISLKYLPSTAKPLTNRQRVRIHIGTQEVLGRVHLLDREETEPGQKVYAQLLLEEPVVADRGDRFVIRHYSPVHTIGGGTILDRGNRKYKRYVPAVMEQLEVKEQGTPKEMVDSALQKAPLPLGVNDLVRLCSLTRAAVESALTELGESVVVIKIDDQGYWFKESVAERWSAGITDAIREFHRKYPLRPGLPKEELKSRFFAGWNTKLFSAFQEYLTDIGLFRVSGNFVALLGFEPKPEGHMVEIMGEALRNIQGAHLAPPDWHTLMDSYKIESSQAAELLQFLLRQDKLVKIGTDMYFAKECVEQARRILEKLLADNNEFTATEAKEKLNTSRKYLIPLLEYMDSQRLTRRVGDKRVKF